MSKHHSSLRRIPIEVVLILLTLPFPERSEEIKRRVKRTHYTRRCPGVWTVCYAIEKAGKIVAVAMYGPAPYPTIARAFCRDSEHIPRVAWQSRMCGAGISSAELDSLIQYANSDLQARGYWWVHTLTDPYEQLVEIAGVRLVSKGYTGEVYHRNGFQYFGWAGEHKLAGFLIDGQPVHIRQGRITLTRSNIREQFPDARSIRPMHGYPKQRWAITFGDTAQEIASRRMLITYQAQPWSAIRQPRLLFKHRTIMEPV